MKAKVDFRSLSLIAESLASLYEDGISILQSLDLMHDLPLNKEYKKSLVNIKNNIIRGQSLGDSFYKNSLLYPSFFCGIADIGERSGELSESLNNLYIFYFNIENVRKKLKSAIRYPLFILFSLLILMVVFFSIIVPNLYETFSSLNKNVPFIMKVFYKAYEYLSYNKLYSVTLIISIICSFILFIKYIISIRKDRKGDFILKIKFVRQYYEYIFMMIISIIINSGIQINRGIDLCMESINIECIKCEMSNLKNQILLGNDLAGSLKFSKFLSKYSLSMISMGEKSGSLDEILKKTSKRLEKNLIEKLDRIISYVNPCAIIIIAVIIVIFIFVFIVPMIDMIYCGVM